MWPWVNSLTSLCQSFLSWLQSLLVCWLFGQNRLSQDCHGCCLVHQLHLLRAWRGLLGTLMSSHLRNQPLNMTSSSCTLATKSFWTEHCFGNPEPGGGCSVAIRYLLWSLLAFASSSQNVGKKRWLSRLSSAVWQIIPKLTDLIFYDLLKIMQFEQGLAGATYLQLHVHSWVGSNSEGPPATDPLGLYVWGLSSLPGVLTTG